MIIGCICGGWIEIVLTASGFTLLLAFWDFINNICKKLGCHFIKLKIKE